MSFIQMSFYGAVLILVVLGIRGLFLNRFPKRVFPILWMVVLIRLLVPVSVPSGFSVYSIFESELSLMSESVTNAFTNPEKDKTETMQEEVTAENLAGQKAATSVEALNAIENAQNAEAGVSVAIRMSPNLLATIIWLAGTLLSAGFLVVCYVKYRREFADSLPVEHKFVKEWLTEHPLARKVTVRQSAKVEAPLTFGIFRPVILMPSSVDWADEEKLNYVLTHEMVHIRRFDNVVKFLMNAAFCIHWFNPFVWLMTRYLNRDLELACDEAVVRLLGENKKADYARTLISMEEKKSSLYPLGSSFSKNAIEERIKAIMKMKKRSLAVIVLAVALVVVVAVGFFTSSNRKREEEDALEIAFDMYVKFFQMNRTVWLDGPKLQDTIVTSDTSSDRYVKVEDESFTSMEDIKAATEEVCTEKFAEKYFYKELLSGGKPLLEKPLYEAREDGLYRLLFEFPTWGGDIDDEKEGTVTILQQTPERIKAKYYYEIKGTSKYVEIFMTIVRQDGKWLVDNWDKRESLPNMVYSTPKEQEKEIVFEAFEAYFDMFNDVWVYGPKLEDIPISSDTCPDGLVKTDDPAFTSLEDIKAATEAACTKAFAEKEYYENYIDGDPTRSVYVMKDGALYRRMVEFGGILFGYGGKEGRENAEVTILEQTPERIKADVGFVVDHLQLYWTVTITIVNQDGKWLVDGWEDTTVDISGQGDRE